MTNASENLADRAIVEYRRKRNKEDADALSLSIYLIAIGRTIERDIERCLAPFQLNYTDFDVVATLYRADRGSITQTQLMQTAIVTSGSMTTCINRLIKRGLVNRNIDPDDRRRRIIELTDDGRSIAEVALDARLRASAGLLQGLPKHRQAALLKALRQSVGWILDTDFKPT